MGSKNLLSVHNHHTIVTNITNCACPFCLVVIAATSLISGRRRSASKSSTYTHTKYDLELLVMLFIISIPPTSFSILFACASSCMWQWVSPQFYSSLQQEKNRKLAQLSIGKRRTCVCVVAFFFLRSFDHLCSTSRDISCFIRFNLFLFLFLFWQFSFFCPLDLAFSGALWLYVRAYVWRLIREEPESIL